MKSSLLLIAALATSGCLPVATAPDVTLKGGGAISEDPGPSDRLRIVSASAVLDESVLRITARIFPGEYGTRYVAQVILDVDRDQTTGMPLAAMGVDRVARLLELDPATNLFPIRAPVRGGQDWGPVVGEGSLGVEGEWVELKLPREALGGTAAVDLRLSVFGLQDGRETGEIPFRDLTAVLTLP